MAPLVLLSGKYAVGFQGLKTVPRLVCFQSTSTPLLVPGGIVYGFHPTLSVLSCGIAAEAVRHKA